MEKKSALVIMPFTGPLIKREYVAYYVTRRLMKKYKNVVMMDESDKKCILPYSIVHDSESAHLELLRKLDSKTNDAGGKIEIIKDLDEVERRTDKFEVCIDEGDKYHCQHLAMQLFDRFLIDNERFSRIFICKTFDIYARLDNAAFFKNYETIKIEIDFTKGGVFYDYED